MDAANFVEMLDKEGVSFFTGVPDSYLHGFCSCLNDKHADKPNVITANEGNAIGVATGYYLATGRTPLVYMQNSGLGNAINPLTSLSLSEMYAIPMILLIGWRGETGTDDHIQHRLLGSITTDLLDSMNIPYSILRDEKSAAGLVKWAVETAKETSSAVALVVPNNVLSGKKVPCTDTSYSLSREQAMMIVLSCTPADTMCVATTGRASRELFFMREDMDGLHGNDLLNVGAMGHVISIGLGLAQALPQRPIVCFDGDAAVLMHMGSMAVAGKSEANNLLHVVLNNGVHESVGGQPSLGQEINLTEIAKACGYATVGHEVFTERDIIDAVTVLAKAEAPGFVDIRTRSGLRPDLPKLNIDTAQLRTDFMREAGSLLDNEKK